MPRGVGQVHEIFVDHALNAEIHDVEGRRFIDFAGGIGVLNTGHRHPDVVAAVREQLDRFTHTCFQVVAYEPLVELAERLNALAPGGFPKKTMFMTTGAEAIENAIKIARAHTRRAGVIAFGGAFHGRTFMTLGLTGKVTPYKAAFGPFPAEIFHARYPIELFGVGVGDAMDSVQRILQHDIEAERVAAVIVEPVQGEGGFYVAPFEFLQRLRELCDRHGILLVCDEVQCGVGRTGKMWACEHEGIEPDILLAAKGLASGMPIGAIIAKESIMKWKPGAHGSTFGGNPVCCAAALATLDVVERELLPNVPRMGERLLAGATRLQEKYAAIGDVRGRGLMIGVEFVKDRATREPAPDIPHQLVERAFKKGLLLLGAGKSALRLAPPLVVDEYDVDTALAIIDESLRELTD
jgi:4-aminobutyrate aminotransferase/(S)-3-amino-2-methylpropionate transaminase